MELRVLKYFITVAEEGNFSRAARRLHLTQPTLSRQIQDLEAELGVKLLKRAGRGASLTEEGIYFRGKAQEILALAGRAKVELQRENSDIAGDVYLACGETIGVRYLANAIKKMRASYPGIICHFLSGNAENAREWLELGLASFGLFVTSANINGMDFVNLPHQDFWGALMRRDDPLASRAAISPAMLEGRDLICSAQALADNEFAGWFGDKARHIRVVATYSLLFNASLLVRANTGVALGLKGIISEDDTLCFRELDPPLKADNLLAWKRNAAFSKADSVFKEFIERELAAKDREENR